MCGLIIWSLTKTFCSLIFLGVVVLHGELTLWIRLGCCNLKLRILTIKIFISDVVEKPVKKYEELELGCGCSSNQNVTLVWIKHTSDKVTIVQSANDLWGPKLINRNEILLWQKVTKDGTSYTCLSQHTNGSTIICGSYAVKMYGKMKWLPIHSFNGFYLFEVG